MEVKNYTPFPNLRFSGMEVTGVEFGVLLVKGTFTIATDGHVDVADEQAPVILTDTYHGDQFKTSLWLPSDMVPKKPKTDIILNAVARAPGGQSQTDWECGIAVDGRFPLDKNLRVTGPRYWEPIWVERSHERVGPPANPRDGKFLQWRLSTPQPTNEVPIGYERAFGGMLAKPQGRDETGMERLPYLEAWQYNPIGCGWIDQELTPTTMPVSAPCIEDPLDPVREPYATHKPQGFGPIPPDWLPRRPLGGTYDQDWIDSRWPNWPDDYDFAYHNSAHPDLILTGYLAGNERVALWGFHGGSSPRILRLPGFACVADLERHDGEILRERMVLDTLLIDIADADPAEHRLFITWRMVLDEKTFSYLSLSTASVEE